MKKAIIDTSFILHCVREKIDFFDEFENKGMMPIIPKQVIQELENLSSTGEKENLREESKLALRIIEKSDFEKPDIGKGHVDKRIKDYSEKHPSFLVASMDKELKFKTTNQKVVVKGRKKLEVV